MLRKWRLLLGLILCGAMITGYGLMGCGGDDNGGNGGDGECGNWSPAGTCMARLCTNVSENACWFEIQGGDTFTCASCDDCSAAAIDVAIECGI